MRNYVREAQIEVNVINGSKSAKPLESRNPEASPISSYFTDFNKLLFAHASMME